MTKGGVGINFNTVLMKVRNIHTYFDFGLNYLHWWLYNFMCR